MNSGQEMQEVEGKIHYQVLSFWPLLVGQVGRWRYCVSFLDKVLFYSLIHQLNGRYISHFN